MIKIFNVRNLIFSTLLISIFIVSFSGCGVEKKKEAKIITPNSVAADTTSSVIKYLVSGSGNGKITITKKGTRVKLELEKIVNGESNIETRFISDGWIYFYFTTETAIQPVKSRISKDHLYLKNFAALADAEEIISRAKKNGNETVAGFTCDIFENNEGGRYSIYNGKYVLQASFDGIIITANTVSFNVPIQNREIEKPDNIEFLELTVAPQ